jgi:aryl-alcohol dehydrogenase-like predicted oxidoreductase
MDRREFVKLGLTTALASGVSQSLCAEKSGEMQYRTLGRTGEKVSIVGLGGYHIGMQNDASESIRIIRAALDQGMNFLDNCWDYNDGESEVRMGKALQNGYRQKAFLMTKIDGRDHQTAAQQIDESLKRLQTGHIDLLQFHEVIRMSDPEKNSSSGRRHGSGPGGQKSGQDPLHRIHWAQESGGAPEDAAHRLRAQFYLRRGADAAQRDGRALRELREEGAAAAGGAQDRRAGHEIHR